MVVWCGAADGEGSGGVVAAEEAGEGCDGFEEERVELGLLVGGALGAEAGDEPVPPGGGVLLVRGGLMAGLVACPPPAQCLGAGEGGAPGRCGGLACARGGVSRG
jgi:hypothetical protein